MANWFDKGFVVSKNCLWLRAPQRPLGVGRKEKAIVSRLRVSVCRRYVHNSDDMRRQTSFNQPTVQLYNGPENTKHVGVPNVTGANCGAGNVHSFRTPDFTPFS